MEIKTRLNKVNFKLYSQMFNVSSTTRLLENGKVNNLSNFKLKTDSSDPTLMYNFRNHLYNDKTNVKYIAQSPSNMSERKKGDFSSPTFKIDVKSPSRVSNKNDYFSNNINTKDLNKQIVLTNKAVADSKPSNESFSKKNEEKPDSQKNNKIMKSIDDLYKSLRLSRDKSGSYRSNKPVFDGNPRILGIDMKDFQLSSPTNIKKCQLVTSYVMRNHSKPKEMKKLNLDNFDKDKKEDSFINFKMEFDFDYANKANRKSFFK